MSEEEYVINPKTNKRIKKSGKLYKKLVKEGIFDDEKKDAQNNDSSKLYKDNVLQKQNSLNEMSEDEDLDLDDEEIFNKLMNMVSNALNDMNLKYDKENLKCNLLKYYD